MNFKSFLKGLIRNTQFESVHIGVYIRRLYFWSEISKLPVERFKKVLDAGCSFGQYSIEFAQRFPHIEIYGIDIRVPQPHLPLPPNCWLRQGDLLNMKESQQYDFIWCIDVLEHIPDNEIVITNLIEALRYDGFLYLHIPYDKPGKRIFPENWFVSFNEWAEKEHLGKQRPLNEWVAILTDAGLEIIIAEWTFGFWGELAWEVDRLTEGYTTMKTILSPVLKFMANLALSRPGSERRGNVLVVGQKNMNNKRDGKEQ